MGLLNKLFGGSAAAAPADGARLPLARDVLKGQSLDLLRSRDVYALLATVAPGAAVPQSEREDYIWALYEAAHPNLWEAIKRDRQVVRAYYFESPHMRAGQILGEEYWFDAQDHYRLPDVYSTIIHFLTIAGERLRFRLKDPQKTEETQFEVRIPSHLLPKISTGPSDVTLMTMFTSNKPICIATMWPLTPKPQ